MRRQSAVEVGLKLHDQKAKYLSLNTQQSLSKRWPQILGYFGAPWDTHLMTFMKESAGYNPQEHYLEKPWLSQLSFRRMSLRCLSSALVLFTFSPSSPLPCPCFCLVCYVSTFYIILSFFADRSTRLPMADRWISPPETALCRKRRPRSTATLPRILRNRL